VTDIALRVTLRIPCLHRQFNERAGGYESGDARSDKAYAGITPHNRKAARRSCPALRLATDTVATKRPFLESSTNLQNDHHVVINEKLRLLTQ
jgi:hypothetical protein